MVMTRVLWGRVPLLAKEARSGAPASFFTLFTFHPLHLFTLLHLFAPPLSFASFPFRDQRSRSRYSTVSHPHGNLSYPVPQEWE